MRAGNAFLVGFGGHVDGGAKKDGDFFVGQHGAAVIDEFHVAEPVDHDVGGLDVGVDEPHFVEGFEATQDLAQDIESDTGLDHDLAVFQTEDHVGEAAPFFVGGAGAGLGQVGSIEQVAQGDSIDHLHLDVADAIAFFIDFGSDERGVFDELELGGLGGDAAHVGPVFFGISVDGRIKEFQGVACDAPAGALPQSKEHDALASAAEFARKAIGHRIVDGAGGENGAVVGDQLTASGPDDVGAVAGKVAQDGRFRGGTGFDNGGGIGGGSGADFQGRRVVEYGFVLHGGSLPNALVLAISALL